MGYEQLSTLANGLTRQPQVGLSRPPFSRTFRHRPPPQQSANPRCISHQRQLAASPTANAFLRWLGSRRLADRSLAPTACRLAKADEPRRSKFDCHLFRIEPLRYRILAMNLPKEFMSERAYYYPVFGIGKVGQPQIFTTLLHTKVWSSQLRSGP